MNIKQSKGDTAAQSARFIKAALESDAGGSTPKAATTKASPEQLRKFEEAARALGTDNDPERFRERVRNLVKGKPSPAK